MANQLSQNGLEAAVFPTSGSAELSQIALESAIAPNPLAELSQNAVEAAISVSPLNKISQMAVEAAIKSPDAQLSQDAIEVAITADTTRSRLSQVSVETAYSFTPISSASGTIGSNSIVGYVVAVRRRGALCQPGQRVDIDLAPSYPYEISPGMGIVLYEYGVKVFTGYVMKIRRTSPEFLISVEADDTYQRLTSFFIEDRLSTNGESPAYWVDRICGMVGLPYQITGTPFSSSIPPGMQLGLRSAHSSLYDVLVYASWYAFPNKHGTLVVGQTLSNVEHFLFKNTEFEDALSDDMTRNRIVVYGGYTLGGGYIRAEYGASVEGVFPDRTSVIASELILDQALADAIATSMGEQLSPLTDITTFGIPGDPTIQIGQRITGKDLHYNFQRSGIVTSIESNLSVEGYLQQITIGERCPRIAGWSPPVTDPDIWVAAHNRGSEIDPYPEKLAWTPGPNDTDWTLVKVLPHGQIKGMQAMNNGTVYVLMYDPNIPSTALSMSANPKAAAPTWTEILGSSSGSASNILDGKLDVAFGGILPIGSLSSNGTSLSLTARCKTGAVFKTAYMRYTGSSLEFSEELGKPNGGRTIATPGNFPAYLGALESGGYPIDDVYTDSPIVSTLPIVSAEYPSGGVPRNTTRQFTGGISERRDGSDSTYNIPAQTFGSSYAMTVNGNPATDLTNEDIPTATFRHLGYVDQVSFRTHPVIKHNQFVVWQTSGSTL